MPFPAKVKLCTESLQSWTRCKGQARLRTTSQALRASSPCRGASGEETAPCALPKARLPLGEAFAEEELSLDTQRESTIIKYIGKTRKVVFL